MTNTKKFGGSNKTKKKRGGIHIVSSYTPGTAINYFINNASFTLFSQSGATGIIIKATIPDNINSPYRMVRTQCFHFPVRHLLLKIFVIGGTPGYIGDWKIMSLDSIINESKIQQQIFKQSFHNSDTLLEPICPAIVYVHAQMMDSHQKSIIMASVGKTGGLDTIESIFENDVGFFAMECMDNYKTLNSLKQSPKYEWYKLIAIHQLTILHALGYMHNDFHFDNVLIHETYNYYDFAKNGRAIIIDFGECTQVMPNAKPDDLLKLEMGGSIHSIILNNIDKLNNMHNHIQLLYIDEIEKKLGCNICEYLNRVILYKGGLIMKPYTMTNKPKKHEWTFASESEINKIMSDIFASNFQNNQKALEEFNEGINSFIIEQQKNPNYFDELMKAQINGLIVRK